MPRWTNLLILGWCSLAVRRTGLADGPPDTLAIRAGKAYTGTGDILQPAVILIQGGRIAAIGENLPIPEGTPVVDFPRQTVLPGLVAAGTTLAGESREARKSISPDILAADGYDYYADRRQILAGGVTTLGVSTGSGRLLSGRGMVIKTQGYGEDIARRILRKTGSFNVTLGELSKRPPSLYDPPVLASPDQPFEVLELQPPVSRGGAFMVLRDAMMKARDYQRRLDRYRRGAGEPPPPDSEAAALLDVLEGREALQVGSDQGHDLLRILEFARDLKVRLVLEGAAESGPIAGALAEAGVPVILDGSFIPGSAAEDDLTGKSPLLSRGLAAQLAAARVRVAIKSPDDASLPYLLLQAVEAVRSGLEPRDALRAVTLVPAEILGVSDRVGSLERGKDADLVICSDDPFQGYGQIQAVYIGGEPVFPRAREFPPDITLIRCGRIYTVAGGEIPGGVIIVRQGKILYAGSAGILGQKLQARNTIDASRFSVIPGLIDCGSQIGQHAESLFPSETEGHVSAGGGKPSYRQIESFDSQDPQLEQVWRAGITTVILSPESSGSIAGQQTAVKLSGKPRRESILKDPAAMLFTAVRPSDLAKAKDYHDKWTAHEKAAEEARKAAAAAPEGAPPAPVQVPEPPPTNEDYDALRPLFDHKLTAVVQAPSDRAVPEIIANLTEKFGVETIFFGLEEVGDSAAEELRRRNIGVLLGVRSVWQKSLQEKVHLPKTLGDKNIRIAFRSGMGPGSRHLPVQVAYAVREGWDAQDALRAMTLQAARLFGIDKQVGSIEEGKDADLVFLNGSPFAMTTRVAGVMVDGEMRFGPQNDPD